MSENKQPNKSIEDLLKTKKNKQTESNLDDSNDMRKKMNRLVDANKVFGDVNSFEDKSEELAKLESEKVELEKNVKELNKKLKNLYNLKYDDLKIIDKKKDDLSLEFRSALDNAKTLNEEEKSRFENMNLELETLQTQIKALKANNIASRKASEEAIAAANLAQEAATRARVAFEEKEKNANKDYKEEIAKLSDQLKETTTKLNKSNVEKNKLKANVNSLKEENKQQLDALTKVENELHAANQEKEAINAKIAELEKKTKENDAKLAKLNVNNDKKQEAKLNKALEEKNALKEKNNALQKELNKAEQKLNKLTEEKLALNDNITNLKQEINDANNGVKKLEASVSKLEATKQEKLSEISNLKKENNALNKKVEKLQTDISALQAAANDEELKKQLADTQKELEKLQANYDKSVNNIEELKASQKDKVLEAKKAANDKAKEEKKLLKQDYSKQIRALNKEIEKLNFKIQEKENEINQIKSELELNKVNQEKEIKELTNKLASSEEQVNALEEKNKALVEENKVISDLNENIEKLNEDIKVKEEKISELEENLEASKHNEEKDKIIDDLSLKLVDSEEEISTLEQKNKELEEENSVIPSLNEEIQKLNESIKLQEEQILVLQEQVKEPKIDESIIKEIDDLQNELTNTMTNLEEMRIQKLNLELELQKAYQALKEQEDLLALQENLITKQQVVVDSKNKDYQEGLIKYQTLESEYSSAKEAYDNELSLLKQDKSDAQDKLVDLFVLQEELEVAKLELQKQALQLEDNRKEIEVLRELKANNEEIIKQYLSDIEVNEKKVTDYLISVSQNELYVEELKNNLETVNKEYEQYKAETGSELKTLTEELELLKEQFVGIEDTSKQLELSKFNEERLQSRIYDLENTIKVLSINENPKTDTTIIASLEQYRTLLTNERKEHEESENLLTEKVKELNKELEELNKRFINYSSSYVVSRLNKQINSVNEIINSIKTGKALFNRDIYNEYYEESLKMYYEQKKIYSSEIEKRNEFLEIIKSEKEQEIKDLTYEVQVNGVNSASSAKLKVLYQQVKDIDLIINSSIRSYAPMSSQAVEEEILKSFKKDLFTYHKQMEENINLIERHINEKYNESKTFESLLEMYSNDCLEMANKYASEINRLYEENEFDSNEISKLIREEKILMLVNEFQHLVNIRDSKYSELQNKLISVENDISYEQYNDSLNSVEELKSALLKKLDSIKLEEQRVKDVLFDERKRTVEDIESLNEQLNQLDQFRDDDYVVEDRRKINVLLAAKREKIDLLNNVRIPEVEERYAALKDEVKVAYDEAIEEENVIKETFTKRKEAINASKNINTNVSLEIKKLNTYEDINSYLIDLNNIDVIFKEMKANRINYRPLVKENQNSRIYNFKSKYNNLWALYDKYELAKTTMEEDFEEIRAYKNFKLESSSLHRKYCELLNEISLSEERFRSGLDLDQNIVKSLHAKANTAKSRVDYLNKQANDLLRYPTVSDYIELVNKIEQIKSHIKQMENEVEGLV